MCEDTMRASEAVSVSEGVSNAFARQEFTQRASAAVLALLDARRNLEQHSCRALSILETISGPIDDLGNRLLLYAARRGPGSLPSFKRLNSILHVASRQQPLHLPTAMPSHEQQL